MYRPDGSCFQSSPLMKLSIASWDFTNERPYAGEHVTEPLIRNVFILRRIWVWLRIRQRHVPNAYRTVCRWLRSSQVLAWNRDNWSMRICHLLWLGFFSYCLQGCKWVGLDHIKCVVDYRSVICNWRCGSYRICILFNSVAETMCADWTVPSALRNSSRIICDVSFVCFARLQVDRIHSPFPSVIDSIPHD